MSDSTQIREPLARLSDLKPECRDDLVYQLLRYNGDVNRLVYFAVEDDIVYITAASDPEFMVEREQIKQTFDRVVELICYD
ncbi:MAG: hypothetical protein SF162_10270 [bacterium]|nr:hypothetical protein [bacterium]